MDGREQLSDPRLLKAGNAVARLSRPTPPPDLVGRTLARIAAGYKPVKRVFWMLRPITNPLARIAAVAAIICTLTPMTDLNLADPLGRNIENKIIGRQGTDRLEGIVDSILVRNGTPSYSQPELDAVIGVDTAGSPLKAHAKRVHSGV